MTETNIYGVTYDAANDCITVKGFRFDQHIMSILLDGFRKAIAAEREACAKIADKDASPNADIIAFLIRSRGEDTTP